MNLTFVDILAGLVVVVSTFYAARRGFLHETLGIFALVAAGFAALYFGPWLFPWMHQHFATRWVAIIAADSSVFVVVYLPLAFLSRRISNSVKSSAIGPLDRVLGVAFGVVRGLATVGLAYIAFIYFVPVQDHPASLTHARSLLVLQRTASVLRSLVPGNGPNDLGIHPRDELGDLIRRNEEPVKLENAAKNTQVPGDHMSHKDISAAQAEKGYGAKDRRALESLVERATGNGGSGKP
jgi:membrane protein required for colicin V production